MAGKLKRRGGINAIRPGSLVFVTDTNTGVKFLADTGATFSILPVPSTPSVPGPPLSAANSAPITTGSERKLTLSFASSSAVQRFEWNFLVGEVSGPILGNDFLKKFDLCVDPATACLRHLATGTVFAGLLSYSLSGST